eukprot:7267731-Pyramimonas_sp.AAC.1
MAKASINCRAESYRHVSVFGPITKTCFSFAPRTKACLSFSGHELRDVSVLRARDLGHVSVWRVEHSDMSQFCGPETKTCLSVAGRGKLMQVSVVRVRRLRHVSVLRVRG